MPELSNPHDRFFKAAFGRPVLAAAFLREQLPAEVAAVLDLDPAALTLLAETYVDPGLRAHLSDLVYAARLRDGSAAIVYVLLEHKSRPEPLVAFQLLRYAVRKWEQDLRAGRPLAPILPVVVYHGRRRWRVGQDMADLFAGPEALRVYWPAFRYHLVDVSVSGAAELTGAPWLRAVLATLRHIAGTDLAARLPELMRMLRAADAEPGLADLWESLVTYLLRAGSVEEGDVRAALEAGYGERGEAMMTTVLDRWFERGLAEGERKGRAEGERRGLLTGIEVALDLKFGTAGLAMMPSVRAIDDVDHLRRLQAVLRTAVSIDDVQRLLG